MRNNLRSVLSNERVIWFVLPLALLIRCGFALRSPFMEWDALDYRVIAQHLASGQGYTSDGVHPETYWAPLVPFLIAGIYRLGGGNLAVREVWALFGVLAVLAVYKLGRERHGIMAANFAGLGATFYPYNILMGASTSTETPNVLLIVITIFSLSLWRQRGRFPHALLAGVTLGLAILNRPAALVFLPLGAVLLCWCPASIPWKRCGAGCGLFVCVTLLVLLPWSIRTSRAEGTACLVTSGGAWNLWYGNNPWFIAYTTGKMGSEEFGERMRAIVPSEATPAEKNYLFLSATKHFVTTHPLEELRLLAFKTLKFWQIPGLSAVATATHDSVTRFRLAILLAGYLSYVPIAMLSVLSIIFFRRLGRTAEIGIYIIWAALTFVSYIWFPAVTRFRFAGGIDNLMILISAAFVSIVLRRGKTTDVAPTTQREE